MIFDKKKIILILIGIAFIIIMAGLLYLLLSKKGQPPAEATLQFWGTFDDRSFYQDAIDTYTQEHSNVRIVYREFSFEDYEKSLISAFAAGTGPDIWLMHNTWLPKHQDKIIPLSQTGKTPIYTFKDFQETFVDVVKADLTAPDGTIYALPLYVDTLGLYYNKETLNSKGISSPPKTWEEFVRDVGLLTKRDDRGNITTSAASLGTSHNINRSTDLLMLLMLQSGTRMTNAGNTSALFSQSVEGINVGELALQFYTDFANQAKPDRYTWNDFQKYSIDAFTDGNAAMMFNYSHHLKTIRAKSPRLNFTIAPMPQPEKATVTVNFANYWAPTVSKQSAAPEEAWKFLVYLATGDATKTYLEVSDRPSARRDLIETQRTTPELGVFAVQSLSARSWYQVDNIAIETIFAKMIDNVNFNRFSVPDALREAESQVNVIMNRQ
ncbi:MAG: extracellular solute-binding protein [Patescibacteria group bacterium]